MKKRIFAAVLAIAVALGAALPAFAADTAMIVADPSVLVAPSPTDSTAQTESDALAEVTIAAKAALGIGDEYESFGGWSEQNGPLVYWGLEWSNEGDSISVRTDGDGKVLSYNRYIDSHSASSYYGGYDPYIPKNSRDEAFEVAKAFVAPLLGEVESAAWEEPSGVEPLSVTTYTFGGTVQFNGVDSPVTFSVRVSADTLVVTRFYRSDSYSEVLPDIPSADAPASIDAASEALKGAYTLELQYVLEDSVPVLRYVLIDSQDLLVDAKTGEVIDLNALGDLPVYGDMEMGKNETMMDASATVAGGLSGAELDAIAKLDGVMSIEALETAAREISALGLDDEFVLTSNSYSRVSTTLEGEEPNDEVTATLYFVRELTREDKTYRTSKRVTLDAKSGEFKYVSGSSGVPAEVDSKALEATAREFAAEYFEHFEGYELYNSTDGRFTFCRYENGVPFTVDTVNVSVDPYDGSILSYNAHYTDGLAFPSPEGVIGLDAALDAYFGAMTVELGYAQLPTALLPTDIEPLRVAFAELGYEYIYEYRLVYGAELADGYLRGVDAMSGEPILHTYSEREPLTYTDLELSYAADIIETLGRYGVGYGGGQFEPTKSLTQFDMLALLLSAVGYDVSDFKKPEDVYEAAKWYGIEFSEQHPEATVSRTVLVRTLVTMTEYGDAAALEGIWAPGFADDDEIGVSDLGYVAIAKALGMVMGDEDGCFNPTDEMSRQDAAIVLYRFLSR